jgi:TonB-dependent receptor
MYGDRWYEHNGLNSNVNDYNMDESTTSFYVMPELNIGKKIAFYPGIRYEQFHSNYLAYKIFRTGPKASDFNRTELTSERDNAYWFPQLHLIIKPTDWLSIRLAKTRSLIRPDYRAFSPFLFFDGYSTMSIRMGNMAIKPAVSENYDLYTSIYSNKIGLFTAGFFYKEIDEIIRPVERISFDPADVDSIVLYNTRTEIRTWENSEYMSTITGIELDWQTNFWYLPVLRGLVFNINYTHILSKTSYPFTIAVKDPDDIFARPVWVDSSRTGPMLHQPDDVLNVTLGYDIGGFSTRLSFQYQGKVLGTGGGSVGSRPEEDSYTEPYYRLDLVLNQKLPLKGLELYIYLNNLTNSAERETQSVLGYLSAAKYYGMTGDIGLRYTF